MFGIGMQELAVIFVVALLIFGPKRLPELARTLGKGLAEFRRASNELRQSFNLEMDAAPRQKSEEVVGQRETIARPDQLVATSDAKPAVDASGHGDLSEDGPMIAPPPARTDDKPEAHATPETADAPPAAVPGDRPRD